MKQCSHCKEIKPLDQFHNSKQTKDGKFSWCKDCSKKEAKRYIENNLEKHLERDKLRCRAYRKKYPEKAKASTKKWRTNNKEKHREYTLAYMKEWRTKNKAKSNFYNAKRRAQKKNATPKWLSKEQRKEILKFYENASKVQQETGVRMAVDHIYPLQGENSCGLNVPWNLQIITYADNQSKRNKEFFDWLNKEHK